MTAPFSKSIPREHFEGIFDRANAASQHRACRACAPSLLRVSAIRRPSTFACVAVALFALVYFAAQLVRAL
jgi:hypothetical protein